MNQTLEERRISLRAVEYKKNEPDMSASPQLKQRRRPKPSKKKLQMDVNKDQVNQGMVISIAKKFETEQAVPKKEEGRYKSNMKHNSSTMFRQISEHTEVFNKHTGPEMALQSGRAARPMAEQIHGHVTSEVAAKPITAQTPEPTENQVEGSHFEQYAKQKLFGQPRVKWGDNLF